MQIEKYTDRLRTLIQSAQSLALRSGHQQLTPLHLLKALLEDEDRLSGNLIDASGATASQVLRYPDGQYLIVRDMGEAREACEYIEGRGDRDTFMARYAHAASPGFDPDRHLRRVGVASQSAGT